ncbi:MAG: lamin tail domain-containing protein, partial [Planctomycetales bacterium]|nr:lamin tail domain-containing protein [Planctomycetales bacterium]
MSFLKRRASSRLGRRFQHCIPQRMEPLEPRQLLAADPIINEFLAANNGFLQDEDGEYSDWIELYNQGDTTADLDGWSLSDDPADLTKWQFPSVSLPPGGYLVVFASNKDRAIAGNELHTNFQLASSGEPLLLVRPDGATIASHFSPAFPQQYEDISYGIGGASDQVIVIDRDSPVDALVPTDDSLGNTWTSTSFVPDTSWLTGTLGVGYGHSDVPPPPTTVLQVDFNDRGNATQTQDGFVSFVMNGSGIQSGSVTRTYGALSVTVEDVSGQGMDDRLRVAPTNEGEFTEGELLQDFIFSRDRTGTSGIDVTVDGLTPNATYTFTVWSFDDGSAGLRVSDWSANGIVAANDYGFDGNAVPPAPPSNNTYRFGVVVGADSQGRVVLQGRRDESNTDFAVFLNALRIETGDALNPPPQVGDVLRVDFGSRTGGEAGAANTEDGYAEMTLDDNGSDFDGITVTLNAFGASNLNDRDRAVPVDAADFTLGQVYDDFVFSEGPAGSGMEIAIAGLVPNTTYEIALRSIDSAGSGTRRTRWTELASGVEHVLADPYTFDGSIAPTSNDDNVLRTSVESSPQGTLLLRGVQLETNRSVVVNALEIGRPSFAGLIGLDLKLPMENVNSSAYMRSPFDVADPASVGSMFLDIQYDSGFVAYINGQEVARRHAPTATGVPPSFDAAATVERSSSETVAAETIDLTSWISLLQGGGNILAIHGMNSAATNDDFLIRPVLRLASDVTQSLRYFDPPTPGAANSTGVVDFVDAVDFSVSHGFFDSPFSLTLSTATANADIYYTYDGSVPAPNNSAAVPYDTPFMVDGTTTIRAAAYRTDFSRSPIGTNTYVFLDDVFSQDPQNNPLGLTFPNTWQANASADYQIDQRVVNQWDDDNPSNMDFGIREALLSLPTMSIVMDHDDLWNSSTGIYPNATSTGSAWRRPGSIEYFDPATGEQFQYNVGIQMHGGASRDNVRLKKHSFRLIFKKDFEGPGRLDFPLFDNADFSDINTVVLRASFTDSFATRTITDRYSPIDSLYMRDVWMRDTQLAMGQPSADSTYVHLCINGLYWGLYSPAERPDDAWLASRLGGAAEDWDVIRDFNELVRGQKNDWNAMFSLARQLPGAGDPNAIYQRLQGLNPDGSPNAGLPAYLDMDNFIDYMMLHLYGGAEDWPSHNWIAGRNRVDPGKGFQFYTWDQEIVLDNRFRDKTESSDGNSPAELFSLLRASSEFRLRFADRVQLHMFNGGALTTKANQQRWMWRADQIEAGIIGESARWGDAREGEVVRVSSGQGNVTVPLMTVNQWRVESARVVNDIIPESHPWVIQLFTADNLYSNGAPAFSQHGGEVSLGYLLEVTSSLGNSQIYFTTDGTDPRLAGGDVNAAAAEQYHGQIALDRSVVIKARALANGQWSPLAEAVFSVPVASGGIVISEINYHPHPPSAAEAAAVPGVVEDDFEFIEVVNTHPTDPVSLANMSLANGLSFTFGAATLAPGEYAVVVEDIDAFTARYGTGIRILGQWTGGVSNSSETIELRDAADNILLSVTYADREPWNESADGNGATLELRDPFTASAVTFDKWYQWRPSVVYGGTPGAERGNANDVVINEVLTHTDLPQRDTIELLNTSSQPIDISGWYLSDSGSTLQKYRIPDGTSIGPGEYVVFDEDDFNPALPTDGQIAFALDASSGDDVYLSVIEAGEPVAIVDAVHFSAAYTSQSFGRVPNGSGRLAPLTSQSLGTANGVQAVSPLLISEILFDAGEPSAAAIALDPSVTAADLQFIEVANTTAATIVFAGERLIGDTSFVFHAGDSLPGGAAAVVVTFDPQSPSGEQKLASFRAHYGLDEDALVFGPLSESLPFDDARLAIQLPDEPPLTDPELLPLVTTDEAIYDTLAPWPITGNSSGISLQRIAVDANGNTASSWTSAEASPGETGFSVTLPGDFDQDGSYTIADFNLLVAAVESASVDEQYDLNDDAIVSSIDVAFLVQELVKPLLGDYNWNSVVDAADYTIWKDGFGSTLLLNADGNADGQVNAADYTIWKDSFGETGQGLPGDGNDNGVIDAADYTVWKD